MTRVLRNIPNILTGLRLFAAPALALLIVGGAYNAACGVFVFAGLSDAADGFLAKRFGLVTRFGRYLDPAADKLLMLLTFVTLTWMGIAPLWLAVLVIGRDVAIVAGLVVARFLEMPVTVEPIILGKLSTAAQIGYIALVLVMLAAGLDWPQMAKAAAYVTGAVTIASWLAYGQIWFRALARRRRRVA
ncbi:MAG TPA: CDP-alcohol phosphatidyltransferase family protein [Rhizomicrobium sp.]|nr:CDP-alcohol phosphatidyltransferase family protein [Rhizomicrobium sp.]